MKHESCWLTMAEACAYLRLGREALRIRMRRKRIAFRKDGRLVFFDRRELDRYAEGQVIERRK